MRKYFRSPAEANLIVVSFSPNANSDLVNQYINRAEKMLKRRKLDRSNEYSNLYNSLVLSTIRVYQYASNQTEQFRQMM